VLLVQEANVVVKHLQSGDMERALQRLDISNRMPWLSEWLRTSIRPPSVRDA